MLSVIRNNNSILGRLIKFISTLISLIIIFSSILYSMREYYYLTQALENEVSVVSRIVGYNYSKSKEDKTTKEHHDDFNQILINSLQMQESINSALFTDLENNEIVSYSRYDHQIKTTDPKSYTKKINVMHNNKIIGYFYIHANYTELNAFLINALYISSWILLISIVLSIIFSYLYSRSLCNPLLKLSNNMHKIIENQDYAIRSEIKKAPDEINDLNSLFNAMLSKIQMRDKKIIDHNTNLQLDIEKKDLALQESYQQLQYAAYHDELTRLPNIRLFKSILENQLTIAKNNNRKFAVLFIDLDNFKQINDSYGHDIGDELLKKISEKFTNTLRRSDFIIKTDLYKDVVPISRLGGDEFTIILNNVNEIDEVDLVADRLIKAVKSIKNVKNFNIHTTISMGIAIYPSDGSDATTLLKHADAAMYHAKSSGKNRYQYYNQDIGNKIKNRLSIESQLADAIINDEFILEYQPKVDINSNELIGLEALVRWKHPEKGVIGPDGFIDISEDSDLICTISDIVVDKICMDIADWKSKNLDFKSIAVNISIRQFEKDNFIENICMNIAKHGIKFSSIELELTEGMLVSNFESAIDKLVKLKNIGFSISIDDFGTGYSSFKYLSKLPVDDIKIDRSFVSTIHNHKNNYIIVRSIINLAHSLNMKVIAEGVEIFEHVNMLQNLNCDYAQGYYYSKPLSAHEVEKYISSKTIDIAS